MEKQLAALALEVSALQLCLLALSRSLPQEYRSRAIQNVENTLVEPQTAAKIDDTPGLADEIRRIAYLLFAET